MQITTAHASALIQFIVHKGYGYTTVYLESVLSTDQRRFPAVRPGEKDEKRAAAASAPAFTDSRYGGPLPAASAVDEILSLTCRLRRPDQRASL